MPGSGPTGAGVAACGMAEIRMVMLAGALWAVPSWLADQVTGRHALGPTQPIAAFLGGMWMAAEIWMPREGQPHFVRAGFAVAGWFSAFIVSSGEPCGCLG